MNEILSNVILFGSKIADYLTMMLEKVGIEVVSSLMLLLVLLVIAYIVLTMAKSLRKPIKYGIIAILIWISLGIIKNLIS